MLPTKALIVAHAQAAGLKLASSEFFGESYARTLAEWRSRFRQNSAAVLALGFDHRFRRLWEYYLGYCEAGFKNEMIDVGLFVFEVDQSSPVPGSG
ncbi:class I SAM-dependent methyltransferase [Mesorhizobium atlanticum]